MAKDPTRATRGRVAVSFVAPSAVIPARTWKRLFVSIVLPLRNISSVFRVIKLLHVVTVVYWPTFPDGIVSGGLVRVCVEYLAVHYTNCY